MSRKVCHECIALFANFYQLHQKCILSQMLLAKLDFIRFSNQLSQIKTEPNANDEYNECLNEMEPSNLNFNRSNDYIEDPQTSILPKEELQLQSDEIIEIEPSEVSNDAQKPMKSSNLYVSETDSSATQYQQELHIDNVRKLRVPYQHIKLTRTCHFCGKRFKDISRNFFQKHLRYHKYVKFVRCTNCWYKCRSTWGIVFHNEAVHHQEHLDDDNLNESFSVHMLTHANSTEDSSEDCSLKHPDDNCIFYKNFPSNANVLQEHLRDEHIPRIETQDNDKIQYKCSFCSQSFKLQFKLNRHLEKAHNNLKSFY